MSLMSTWNDSMRSAIFMYLLTTLTISLLTASGLALSAASFVSSTGRSVAKKFSPNVLSKLSFVQIALHSPSRTTLQRMFLSLTSTCLIRQIIPPPGSLSFIFVLSTSWHASRSSSISSIASRNGRKTLRCV